MFNFVKNIFKKKKAKTFEVAPIVTVAMTDVEFLRLFPNPYRDGVELTKRRKGNKTSFKKGNIPWNKGKKKNGK